MIRGGRRRLASLVLIALASGGCIAPATSDSSVASSGPSPSTSEVADPIASPPPSVSPAAGSVGPSASPESSSPAAPSEPAPSAAAPAVHIVVDPSLAKQLPQEAGPIRFARRDLAPGATPPAPVDIALLASMREQVASGDAAVSVGWIEAAGKGGGKPAPHAIAIRIHGATGLQLRNAFLGEILTRGRATEITAGWGDAGVDNLYLPDAILSWADDILYVVALAPGGSTNPAWPTSDFLGDIPASPYPQIGRDMPIDGVPVPLPSIPADAATRHDDPGLEALLPTAIDGHPMELISLEGPIAVATVYLALPMISVDLGGVPVDARVSTAAYGRSDELDSFSMLSARMPGMSARRLLGAWVGTFVSQRAGSTLKVDMLDVDARTLAIVDDNEAIHVRDGLIVEMRYLDIGDSFGVTMPPRPALRDLAIAAVQAMPAP